MTARRCDVVRLAASTSFTAAEIAALDQLVRALLSGSRIGAGMRLSPAVASLARKVVAMKRRVAHQRLVRDELASQRGQPDPARQYRSKP